MKNTMKTLIALAAVAAGASTWLIAQDGPPPQDGQGGPGGGGRRPVPPIIAALDANSDGVIDANEIANASAALKKLDKNGDGKLTQDELRPAPPEGGPGGQRGPRQGSQSN